MTSEFTDKYHSILYDIAGSHQILEDPEGSSRIWCDYKRSCMMLSLIMDFCFFCPIRPLKDSTETISSHRQAPGWIRQTEVRKAADKEEARREVMERRVQVEVYTDGSDIDGGVGAAAILYRDSQRQGTLRAHLGPSTLHTIYEGELTGILLAIHLLRKAGGWQTAEIALDSQAAIGALNLTKPAGSHYMVDEIHRQLKAARHAHPAAKLTTRWIPDHMEIEGNEQADDEAKKAARGDASPPSALPTLLRNPLPASTSAIRRAYKETIKRDAATHLAKSRRYPRFRAIDSSVPSAQFRKLTAVLKRKQASLLTQLRTGHIT